MIHTALDPVRLAIDLIRCPSVTPEDAGALDVIIAALLPMGFVCHDLSFGSGAARVRNVFATRGTGSPHILFAGHSDVVPPGDPTQWSVDPFAGELRDGLLIGRGAADMKGAIAAFIAAISRLSPDHGGAISLLITGDEEGVAEHGTIRVLPKMADYGIAPDLCIVGEPTSARQLGDMVKIGRRGSLNGTLTVQGAQGHVAYPHLADNPIPRLIRLAQALIELPLDQGDEWFQPSNLEITTIDVGNGATNVIPARASLRFNLRFNALWRSADLIALIRRHLDQAAGGYSYDLAISVSGEAFLTAPGALSDRIGAAIRSVTGLTPDLSTTGGTSDARFIRAYCPVVEFGLVGASMHKVDEAVPIADLTRLSAIYETFLRDLARA